MGLEGVGVTIYLGMCIFAAKYGLKRFPLSEDKILHLILVDL